MNPGACRCPFDGPCSETAAVYFESGILWRPAQVSECFGCKVSTEEDTFSKMSRSNVVLGRAQVTRFVRRREGATKLRRRRRYVGCRTVRLLSRQSSSSVYVERVRLISRTCRRVLHRKRYVNDMWGMPESRFAGPTRMCGARPTGLPIMGSRVDARVFRCSRQGYPYVITRVRTPGRVFAQKEPFFATPIVVRPPDE